MSIAYTHLVLVELVVLALQGGYQSLGVSIPMHQRDKAVQLGFQQTLRIVKLLCPCSSSLIATEKKKATKTNKQETKRDSPEYFLMHR